MPHEMLQEPNITGTGTDTGKMTENETVIQKPKKHPHPFLKVILRNMDCFLNHLPHNCEQENPNVKIFGYISNSA